MVKDDSLGSRLFEYFNMLLMVFLIIVTGYPILHILAVSLSDPIISARGEVSIFPKGFTLDSYKIIWAAGTVPRAFVNSIIYTVFGTLVNMLLTIMIAYALSKKRLVFRGFYMKMVIVTMFFGGGLIPTFLVVRGLGMYDTIWALILPGAISVFNMIILRAFFEQIPAEVEESAFVDGANDFTVLFRIVIPLSMAAIATITLFYLVSQWNSYLPALIYLKDAAKFPLTYVLRDIVIQGLMAREMAEAGEMDLTNAAHYMQAENIKYSTLFVSIFPMLIVYPYLQKYFVKGIIVGSLKG
ncbi:carbohydrate ABC transporter permease [Paenibacillus sp. 1P07SE]|uniref:carbohydrate ABC transporter permease n=1 Tax=Paenibacillus sp. 1P07SE TaxID=3132209 RepID=UPI0039A6994C